VANKRTKRPTVHSFLDLEARLNQLSISVDREDFIRDLLRAGKGLIEVAREAGVDVSIVQRIKDGKSGFDKEVVEGIISHIKEICSQLQLPPVQLPPYVLGAEGPYAEWFCEKLRSRGRSSGDFVDYLHARDRLLTQLAEISTKKQRQILKERGRQRHEEAADRNIKLAEEFRRKYKPGSPPSASALKAAIGAKEGLTRSAAIAAVDDGLRRLSAGW
jgi:hypothetical protein